MRLASLISNRSPAAIICAHRHGAATVPAGATAHGNS